MNIIFFQTWGIGDMIMSLPAIAALRSISGHHKITVVSGNSVAQEIVRLCGVADEVLLFKHYKNCFWSLLFFWKLRRFRFEQAVVAYGLSPKYSFLLKWISGIQNIRNSKDINLQCEESGPRLHRALANLAIVGESATSQLPKIKILLEAPVRETEKVLDSIKDAKPLIGIHPGGGKLQQCKSIPKTMAIQIIGWCKEIYPRSKFIIVLGPDEQAFIEDYKNLGADVLVASGLSIAQTAAVIAKMKVFICGDTGLGHLAGLAGVPVLTLAGPTDADVTHPWGGKNIVLRAKAAPSCAPCYYSKDLYTHCPLEHNCMHAFNRGEITGALSELLPSKDPNINTSAEEV